MANLIVTAFITLDGNVESPHEWSFAFQSEDTGEYNNKVLFDSDTMLLGRVTYEGFAAAWPGRTDEDGFADKFNSMPKVVVSTTLETADWQNSTIVRDDVVAAVQALKDAGDGDVLVWGSPTLVQFLIANDLVDAFELLMCPVLSGGGGKKLFADNGTLRKLERVEVTPLSGGMTALRLRPARV